MGCAPAHLQLSLVELGTQIVRDAPHVGVRKATGRVDVEQAEHLERLLLLLLRCHSRCHHRHECVELYSPCGYNTEKMIKFRK